MKLKQAFLATLLAWVALGWPVQTSAINKVTPIYMFGLVTSFNDSTIYLTEIQYVDSAWTDTKTHFLYSRDNYAHQLRDHMKETGIANPTSTVFFAEKRKNIEKKYLKIRKRYTIKGTWIVNNMAPDDFHFRHITPDTPEATYTKEELKAAIKKEKAELKTARKEAKVKAKTDKKEKKAAKEKAMADAKQRARELRKKP